MRVDVVGLGGGGRGWMYGYVMGSGGVERRYFWSVTGGRTWDATTTTTTPVSGYARSRSVVRVSISVSACSISMEHEHRR